MPELPGKVIVFPENIPGFPNKSPLTQPLDGKRHDLWMGLLKYGAELFIYHTKIAQTAQVCSVF